MPILRKQQRKRDFLMVQNVTVQDRRLSWKARGLLLYLLSMPDDWSFNQRDLINRAPDQYASLRSGLSELEELGYLDMGQPRDVQGRWQATDWIVRELPVSGFPISDNPISENQTLQSTHDDKVPIEQRKDRAGKPATPPAVKVFREMAHRYPAKSWYQDIDLEVGDDPDELELWGKVVKAYVGLGWNPTNVKVMLEFYQRGEIPTVKGQGKPSNEEVLAEWLAERTG